MADIQAQILQQMLGGRQAPTAGGGGGPEQQILDWLSQQVASDIGVEPDDTGTVDWRDVGPQQVDPAILRVLGSGGDMDAVSSAVASYIGVEPDDTGSVDWRDVGPQQVPPEVLKLLAGGGGSDPASAILKMMGADAGQRGPIQVGPTPADENSPSRFEDPLFQEVMALWIEKNGREPATDGEFQEIENAVFQMQEQLFDNKRRP